MPDSIRTRPARSANHRYTSLTWLDDYEVPADEPGAARYAEHRSNRLARAALVEQRASRPWLVCVHGFGMGSPGLDLRRFAPSTCARTSASTSRFPVLPFHGRRNPGGDAILTRGPGDRRPRQPPRAGPGRVGRPTAPALLRERTDQPIGLMGLSLGGAVAATVASLDEPDAVLLLAPAVDLPTLMQEVGARFSPDEVAASTLAERSRVVLAPVSPLALEPKVPVDRRAIFSGTLDLFAKPSTQAVALWRHWDEPELHWYHGGHVSLFWSPSARKGIDASLRRMGLASRADAAAHVERVVAHSIGPMSLTAARGPFGADPEGWASPPLPAGGSVFIEPHPRRIQAVRGDETVLDTERALLVHRPGRALAFAFPADVVGDLPSEPEPEAAGYVQVPWDAVDTWYQEGRRLVHYPPNPYHRIDCHPTTRRLRAEAAGVTLVDTDDTVILFETSLGPKLYVDPIEGPHGPAPRSDTWTWCNYKGDCTYWSLVVGDTVIERHGVELRGPFPESLPIKGLLSFDPSQGGPHRRAAGGLPSPFVTRPDV